MEVMWTASPKTTLKDCPFLPAPLQSDQGEPALPRPGAWVQQRRAQLQAKGAVRGAEAQAQQCRGWGALVACWGQGHREVRDRYTQVRLGGQLEWRPDSPPLPEVRPLLFRHQACHRGLTQGHLAGTLWQLAIPCGQGSKGETKSLKTAIKKGQKGTLRDEEVGKWPRVASPAHTLPPVSHEPGTGESGPRGPKLPD